MVSLLSLFSRITRAAGDNTHIHLVQRLLCVARLRSGATPRQAGRDAGQQSHLDLVSVTQTPSFAHATKHGRSSRSNTQVTLLSCSAVLGDFPSFMCRKHVNDMPHERFLSLTDLQHCYHVVSKEQVG